MDAGAFDELSQINQECDCYIRKNLPLEDVSEVSLMNVINVLQELVVVNENAIALTQQIKEDLGGQLIDIGQKKKSTLAYLKTADNNMRS